MEIGIYGKKIGMTQIFNKDGNCIPATVVQIYSSNILSVKENLNGENNTILTGTNVMPIPKESNIKKSLKGFFKKMNLPFFNYIKEYKLDKKNSASFLKGNIFDIKFFEIGETLKISGISSGKGNQGNIKRNNFKRGPMTHGSKHHRLQGSLGAGTTPGRVFPGKKMAGRTGNQKTTITGIKILDIFSENNLIVLKGSIPGKFGSLIELKKN